MSLPLIDYICHIIKESTASRPALPPLLNVDSFKTLTLAQLRHYYYGYTEDDPGNRANDELITSIRGFIGCLV